MITSKAELREYIEHDNVWYKPVSFKDKLIGRWAKYPAYNLKRYLYFLRKQEFYINTAKGNRLKGLLGLLYERKKNKLGSILGIEIGPNCFGKGLQLYHGNIVINPSVRVGENCKLHGNNCIGNNGIIDVSPQIGNNVDIGFGAIIIGPITLANGITIGANALVNKSFCENESLIAGVPARLIRS